MSCRTVRLPVFRGRLGRGGFTLIELIASLSIMTILLAATTSVIVIMSRGLPSEDAPWAQRAGATEVAGMLAAELQEATSISTATATAVEFTVADRDVPPDGVDEIIRYEWSGTAGAPLTRRSNGGTITEVCRNVESFELAYVSRAASMMEVEGAEALLAGYVSTSSLSDYVIKKDSWVGAHFSPALPSDAKSWKVTRVRIRALRNDQPYDDVTDVQLRRPGSGKLPGTDVLESAPMYEAGLSGSFTWQALSFSNVAYRSPVEGLCLVLKTTSKDGSCRIEYRGSVAGGAFLESSGGAWKITKDKSICYEIYGSVTREVPDPIPSEYTLLRAEIALNASSSPNSRATAIAIALNEPRMP